MPIGSHRAVPPPPAWKKATLPTRPANDRVRLGWERELHLHDLKGDALLELGTGMSGPHHFGQWVKHFYYHWQAAVCHYQHDTLDHFYRWLEVELHQPILKPEIARILEDQIAHGPARVKPWDKTKGSLNEIQRFLSGVKYITTEADRIKYLMRFHGGLVYRRERVFDTTETSTVFSGPGWAIWVKGPNGNYYSHSHKIGRIHHSTFLGGGAVLGAGEWQIIHGRILKLSGKSGHYQPGMESLCQTIQDVANAGLFHPNAVVCLYSRLDKRKVELNHRDVTLAGWTQLLEDYVVDPNSNEQISYTLTPPPKAPLETTAPSESVTIAPNGHRYS